MNGILFKPNMIKATAERRKTQTRRLSGLEEINKEPDNWKLVSFNGDFANFNKCYERGDGNLISITKEVKPRYHAGEVVYIKEKIVRKHNDLSVGYDYATYTSDLTPVMFFRSLNRFVWRWKKDYLSPLHLPHEAARYFLKILSVKPQRLQEITLRDVETEGTPKNFDDRPMVLPEEQERIKDYSLLWNSINKEHQWASNPFVWRYEFKLAEVKQ